MDAYFLDPSGQVVAVDPSQAPAVANARGYTQATPDQIAEFQAAEKFGSTGQQVIAGAEGLARGLTARLSTGAEVALGVDPEGIAGREAAHPMTAALSEGVGVAAPLVATLGGSAAEQGLVRGAAEMTAPAMIATVGKKLGGKVVGGMAEGALYGAGQVVHEAALGDPNLTAQSALATVGLSAALAGGLAGVIGAGESALRPAIARAKTAIGELASGIATPEKLRVLAQEQHDAMGKAARLAFGEIRPAETAALITTPPQAAWTEMDRLANRLTEVAGNMRANPDLFPSMFPAKLEQIREGLLSGGIEGLPPGDVFTSLNDARLTIDKQLGKWGRFISPEQMDAVGAIRGLRTEFKTALENEGLWGPAGARQAAFQDAYSEWMDAAKEFRKEFMQKRPGKGTNPVYTMDAGKLSHLSDTANARYPMRQEAWSNYQDASKRLLNEIENSHVNAPVSHFDKTAVEGLINRSGAMEQSARQQGAVLRMLGRMGGIGPTGMIAGGVVGGPMGAAIGAATDIVAKGAKFIPRAVDALSHLHANNEAVAASIGSAAAALAKGAARVGRGEVAAGIGHEFGLSAEDAAARFEKHATHLRAVAANPEPALEGMTAGLHEHAPQTAQAMTVTASRAVAFLSSKLPPGMKPGPLSEALPVSRSDIAKYNRYREAVEKPASVLRQAAAGTLTPEAVEALQAVYPHLYQQIQGALIEHLTPDVPHRVKLMSSMLLGRDLDGSMNGPAILREQMRYVKPPLPHSTPSKAAKLKGGDRAQTNAQRAAGASK